MLSHSFICVVCLCLHMGNLFAHLDCVDLVCFAFDDSVYGCVCYLLSLLLFDL